MRLTRGADYALRVIIHMSGSSAARRISRSAIAAVTGIPEAYLAKILQSLVRASLIRSRPGVHGGFELSRVPNQISMLEVIEAIDGPTALASCVTDQNSCERSPWCGIRQTLLTAQEAMVRVLRSASIQDLVSQSPVERPLQIAAIVPVPVLMS
jgi:Rrf2 family protein